jgi:hypothetical protein
VDERCNRHEIAAVSIGHLGECLAVVAMRRAEVKLGRRSARGNELTARQRFQNATGVRRMRVEARRNLLRTPLAMLVVAQISKVSSSATVSIFSAMNFSTRGDMRGRPISLDR